MINIDLASKSDSLVGKTVAIFGATGFIGSHVVDRFLDEGCNVKAYGRSLPGLISPNSQYHSNFKLISLDLSDKLLVNKALTCVDVVISMASSSLPHNSNNDPHNDIQSNLIGSLNLLDASVENNISKFVFISSGGTVYGPPIDVPILETHPTNPICSYGIVKLAIEKYVMLYQKLYNLNSTILRLANPYGERQRLDAKQGVVPVFMHRAMNNLPLEVWGDGSVIRDFLYISDVVEAIRLSCIYNGNNTIFNIGSGVGMSLNELIQLLEDITAKQLKVIYKPSRVFDVPTNVLSIDLAQSSLRWTPRVSPKQGIKNFYKYISLLSS